MKQPLNGPRLTQARPGAYIADCTPLGPPISVGVAEIYGLFLVANVGD